jgi:hypothetical protein
MATVSAERDRGAIAAAFVAERSTSILDKVAIEIRSEEDPELTALLADARVAVKGLRPETP